MKSPSRHRAAQTESMGAGHGGPQWAVEENGRPPQPKQGGRCRRCHLQPRQSRALVQVHRGTKPAGDTMFVRSRAGFVGLARVGHGLSAESSDAPLHLRSHGHRARRMVLRVRHRTDCDRPKAAAHQGRRHARSDAQQQGQGQQQKCGQVEAGELAWHEMERLKRFDCIFSIHPHSAGGQALGPQWEVPSQCAAFLSTVQVPRGATRPLRLNSAPP